MKYITLLAVLASTALVGQNQSSNAAPMAIITSVTGYWSDVVSPVTVGLTGVGTNQIKWGTPVTAPLQSGYTFVGAASPTQYAQNVTFNLGTFTHTNQPIYAEPEPSSITSARLNVQVMANFSNDNFATFTSQTVNSVFDFAHNETTNSGACANGPNGSGANINGCADSVTPTLNLGASGSFVFDNIVYVFATSGFDLGPIFWTMENAINSAGFTGRFITRAQAVDEVPLPAALPLLGGALAGMGYLSRRQRKQKLAAA